MKTLNKVAGFLWALWGGFWFMLVVSIFTVLYAVLLAIGGKKYSWWGVWINCHYLSPFLLFMWLIRVKAFGRNNISSTATYVYVANHRSQVDTLVTAAAVPHPVRFLAKSELKHVPFFGYMVKMLAIMVDRKSKESREKSLRYMMRELDEGHSIFIYPEGTRNRTNMPLKEFKDGAFKLAILSKRPVVVLTLLNTRKVNNPKGIHLLPGKVEVHYSRPIETAGMTIEDLARLETMVKEEMQKHLEK